MTSAAPTRARRRRPLPPRDAGLPNLTDLLTPEGAQRLLGAPTPLRATFVDYAPGRRVTVMYDGATGDPRLAHAGVEGSTAQHPPRADATMPALALAHVDLAARLGRAGITVPDSGHELVAYRPGTRAVVRAGGVVLKTYADPEAFRSAAWAQAATASAPLRSPAFLGCDAELRLCAQEFVSGERLSRDQALGAAVEAGAALRTLHGWRPEGARPRGPAIHLDRAARSAALVAVLVPEAAPRLGRLIRRLAEDLPWRERSVASHGDFNVGQLVRDEQGLVVLDVDELAYCAEALDPAAYAANLIGGRDGDRERAREALERIVDGLGRRPAALGWYTATVALRRAPNPFRLVKSRWPERVMRIVVDAEAALSW